MFLLMAFTAYFCSLFCLWQTNRTTPNVPRPTMAIVSKSDSFTSLSCKCILKKIKIFLPNYFWHRRDLSYTARFRRAQPNNLFWLRPPCLPFCLWPHKACRPLDKLPVPPRGTEFGYSRKYRSCRANPQLSVLFGQRPSFTRYWHVSTSTTLPCGALVGTPFEPSTRSKRRQTQWHMRLRAP